MESSENETQFKKCRAVKLRFFFVKVWRSGREGRCPKYVCP
jgi:hypothetical protein